MVRIVVVVCVVCMLQLGQELEVLVFVGSVSLLAFARGVLELEGLRTLFYFFSWILFFFGRWIMFYILVVLCSTHLMGCTLFY